MMNNRELVKELLTLSDEALQRIGRRGMAGEHGRTVAGHYAGGGRVEVLSRLGWKVPRMIPFDVSPENYRIKKKMIVVNGVEVPAPETEAPEMGKTYYVPAHNVKRLFNGYIWSNYEFDLRMLEQGLVYLKSEDAIARATAMLKVKEVTNDE